MTYKNMLIQPFTTGEQTDLEAHLIPDTAFATLRNMTLYRGRIRRKFGYAALGRPSITVTAGVLGNHAIPSGNINVFTLLGITGAIVPGSVTVSHAGVAGNYVDTVTRDGNLRRGGVIEGTINYATGIITLDEPNPTGAGAVTITLTYYPCRPIMGLPNRELVAYNFEELIAFDPVDAYVWNSFVGAFNQITPAGSPWTSDNSHFFWSCNYWTVGGANLLWVTNNFAADRIRYYAGGGAGGWTIFTPQLNAGNTRQLWTSKLIVAYRNRLVTLNTTERDTVAGTTTNYQSRARWSANGDPTVAANWQDDAAGLGGFNDAPTSEKIITARFVKDTLIVGFERSTWALKYTGNEVLPFIWERVHEEYGCESTFSSIVFDTSMLQVGFRGINAANSNNVERIDLKVPYLVHQIHNDQDGQERVHGIRDYGNQMVYWTYPTATLDDTKYRKTFPDSVIAYNYLEQAFATYDASFTCFGYFEPANDARWMDFPATSWAAAKFAWNSGQLQSGYPNIVAGNQVGFVHKLNDTTSNSVSVYITDITLANPGVITAPNHNFQDGQCIEITDCIGTIELNRQICFTNGCVTNAFTLQVLDTDTTSATYGQRIDFDISGYSAYLGGGLITTIDNFSVLTKQYNPYQSEDVKVRIGITELLLSTTALGEISADVLIDQNEATPMATFTVDTSCGIEPLLHSGKYWQKIYTNTVANYIQLKLSFNDFQMIDLTKSCADIELHAINIQASSSGKRSSFS